MYQLNLLSLDVKIVLLDVKPALVAIKLVMVVLKLASLLIADANSDNVLSKSGEELTRFEICVLT